jgi:hypothetical protein
MVWGLDKLGRGDRIFRAIRQGLAGDNPFGNYAATRHDVFIAAYGKSGTNWTMQIAQQRRRVPVCNRWPISESLVPARCCFPGLSRAANYPTAFPLDRPRKLPRSLFRVEGAVLIALEWQ